MVGRLILAASVAVLLLSPACDPSIDQVQVEEQFPAPEQKFDLNTVTLEELDSIPELRSDAARNIIAFQQEFGFRRVEDLLNVEGIGEATFLKIRRYFYILDNQQTRED